MQLLGITESKITKDKNGENVPHAEINEVVLVHLVSLTMIINKDSRALYKVIPNTSFGQLLDLSPRKLYIFKNLWFRIFTYWSVVSDQNPKSPEI